MHRLSSRLGRTTVRGLATGLAFAMLLSCGGDGDDRPAYGLAIHGGEAQTTSLPEHLLTGEGFLPPGSTCRGDCSGLMPPPVFGELGPYELWWRNAATGVSGPIALRWQCNCGGGAPFWLVSIPVQPGPNPITVSMRAGGYEQKASVVVTRQ